MTVNQLIDASIEQWRTGGETGDARIASRALAADAVLVSPLTDRFTFSGDGVIEELLTAVFSVFVGIRYRAEFRDGNRAILIAAGHVGERELQETQHLEFNEAGQIQRITLMMRPLPALTGFLRALGPRLARLQNRGVVAGILVPAGALLDTVASAGDSTFMPLADPERGSREGRQR